MHCSDACEQMPAALEGTAAPELHNHLASCATCGATWAELVRLDALLRRQALIEPSVDLTRMVMEQLNPRSSRRAIRTRGPAAPLLVLAAGVLIVVLAAVVIGRAEPAGLTPQGLGLTVGLLQIGGALAQLVIGRLFTGPLVWLSYAALAAAMAAMWFGALVVPRMSLQPVDPST